MSKIKVYLKSEEISHEIPGRPSVEGHPCQGFKHEVVVKLPEDHERAKEIVEEVAEEEGLDVEICDLRDSFRSRVVAFLKGIRTPSIEIRNKHINGVPSKEEILSLLNKEPLVA